MQSGQTRILTKELPEGYVEGRLLTSDSEGESKEGGRERERETERETDRETDR